MFLDVLVDSVFKECGRVLRPKKYMCIVVSDFRNKSEFISFHSDLIQRLNHLTVEDGFQLTLQGVKVLAQNHKVFFLMGTPSPTSRTSTTSIFLFSEKDVVKKVKGK